MHNKIFVSDGAVAVVGGRNIGDDYFGLSTEANFRDLDVAAAGPIVRDIAAGFDGFWNNDWAYPVAALVERQATPADLEKLRTALRPRSMWTRPFPLDDDIADLKARSTAVSGWKAPGRFVADDSSSLTRVNAAVCRCLVEQMAAAEREILIESAYFVQRKPGVEAARRVATAAFASAC
jgi:putative cardiolipin synthase